MQCSASFGRIAGRLLLVAIAVSAVSCSRSAEVPPEATQVRLDSAGKATAPPPVADAPPMALVSIGESAEGLFDAARASQWQTAADNLQALNEAATQLPRLPKANLVAQLRSQIDAVRQSTVAHSRVETMEFANDITRIVADLSAEFQIQVPIAVVMLDYWGRQLELGIATGNQSTLAQATADLRQQWDRIQPTIEHRGHVGESRRFSDIVVQLEGARTPADFVAPTRAELDAVDRLEAIFQPSR